jgi:hypothetical protein
MVAVTDEHHRGYSLQEHVEEAERDIMKDNTELGNEARALQVRVVELEKVLKDVREIMYGADVVEDLAPAVDMIDEVL